MPPLYDSNNDPYNYDYHTLTIILLEDNINSGSITNYETTKLQYDEIKDSFINDKLQVKYTMQPNIYSNNSTMHVGIHSNTD